MTRINAIIPARCGSKSVAHKNIAELAGYPLLAFSIAAAQLSRHVDRIILSTDSTEYSRIGQLFGAEAPFLRPAIYSTDTSTDRDFMLHALHWWDEHKQPTAEYWVHLRPTTPLRNPAIIDAAIEQIISSQSQVTSLRSGHKAPESPFKWFQMTSQGLFKSLVAGTENQSHLPKEQFVQAYIPDGYIDVLKRSVITSEDNIHGEQMLGYESPVCTEVDSPEEFNYLTWQLSKIGSPLLDYLDNHYGELKNQWQA